MWRMEGGALKTTVEKGQLSMGMMEALLAYFKNSSRSEVTGMVQSGVVGVWDCSCGSPLHALDVDVKKVEDKLRVLPTHAAFFVYANSGLFRREGPAQRLDVQFRFEGWQVSEDAQGRPWEKSAHCLRCVFG